MSFKQRVLYGEGVCLRTFTTVGDVRLWSWLQVIFSQQVIGYPRRRELALTCELFGLAGHYVLTLRSKLYTAVPVMDSEPAHLKVHACSSEFAHTTCSKGEHRSVSPSAITALLSQSFSGSTFDLCRIFKLTNALCLRHVKTRHDRLAVRGRLERNCGQQWENSKLATESRRTYLEQNYPAC